MDFGKIYASSVEFWRAVESQNCAAVVFLHLSERKGSAPRDAGSWMLVHKGGFFGSIGGGRLEAEALMQALLMLQAAEQNKPVDQQKQFDFALGPASGQCCGGRVAVELRLVAQSQDQHYKSLKAELDQSHACEQKALRSVYIFGAGHVGRAILKSLAPLPFVLRLYDNRPAYLEAARDLFTNEQAEQSQLEIMQEVCQFDQMQRHILNAQKGTAFVIMTQDHNLDFLLAKAALEATNAAYVGMIGSQTKRAKFFSWLRAQSKNPQEFEKAAQNLICPLGQSLLGFGTKCAIHWPAELR